MKVTIFGIGYVGLVQAAVLAEVGHDVVCVDVDEAKVAGLRQGIIPIFEPGLESLVRSNHTEERLVFTTNAIEGVEHGDVIFIAVGTPPDEDGSADLQYVLGVAQTIGEYLTKPCIVVNKSTVPVGTAQKVRQTIESALERRHRHDVTFDVVSNPEFLKEGAAVADCMRPDRIIIGTSNQEAGAGYGGSCFPKDIKAMIRTADNVSINAGILKAVEERNELQKQVIFQKIMRHFDDNVRGLTFALWGLSFKPNTDDMRDAPSRVLIEALFHEGAKIQAYDPQAMEEAQRLYGSRNDLALCGTKEAALKDADALIIMTDWRAFKVPDFEIIQKTLTQPVIFNGRNLYDPKRIQVKGIQYYSIGRVQVAMSPVNHSTP